MSWLQSLDVALFRFVNQTLSNPLLDSVMPIFNANPFFFPGLVLLGGWLLWKGGARGRLFVFSLLVILTLGDMVLINTIKHAVARPRPYNAITDAYLRLGGGISGSMPSSHTSSWFAATLVTFVYYRRTAWFLLPLAATIGFSRIYLGVHYPGDVLAGAVLGAGYAAAGLWAGNAFWQRFGREWFPDWWQRLPSLLTPALQPAVARDLATARVRFDQHLLRLGYLVIAALLLARLLYLASGAIELAEDEAYQWLWSKHLALSYYSKPPLIACAQFLGTALWGDNAFGVRFFSPVIAALLGWLLLRFMARTVSVRAGFWLLLIVNCAPLMAVGATLMTVDPLLVLFWTAAMIAGWRAVQPDAFTRHWLWTGMWMGLGFLSKYSAAFQIICWVVFFALWPPARRHLRRPGPWLALLINFLCALPVIAWNWQHQWITVKHVSENANFDRAWEPTLRYFRDFLGAEMALLHPVFFVAALWAMFAFWKTERKNPWWLYCFSMGAPVFLGYWLFTFHSRVLPNWIAPAVLPMFCLMVAYWEKRWLAGVRALRPWLIAGLSAGYAAVLLLHNTDYLAKLIGRALPPQLDPLRRVRAWEQTTAVAGAARLRLLDEGKPVFIIAGHYGLVGELSMYLPEARTNVCRVPLVYYQTSVVPRNQFYFWPGYRDQRRGENAIFVHQVDLPDLKDDWWYHWLRGRIDLAAASPDNRIAPPPELREEFDSVSDLGVFDIQYRERVFRRLQLFACRNLH